MAEPLPREQGFAPGLWTIDRYGAGGFVFAGMTHRGSILALPTGIHAWAPVVPPDIDSASLRLLFDLPRGEVELLLVGMGAAPAPLPKMLRQTLLDAGIRCDVMTTGAAISTWNILIGERRRVAAALLATP